MLCSNDAFFMHEDADCLNPLHLLNLIPSLMVLGATALLDSPSLPYFGSITMVVGYPRPQRFWPRFQHALNPGVRIEALIYESILVNLMK